MNFFRRRKILKNVNSLLLVPVRVLDHETNSQGKIDLLLPRFDTRVLRTVYRNSKKGEFIRIHLDPLGSSIWELIDGNRNIEEICSLMKEIHPEKLQPIEETEIRITQFISLLYRERYISFAQLQDKINTSN